MSTRHTTNTSPLGRPGGATELRQLAQKYENKEFLVGDPSWWMHQIEGETNKELLAFIAAALSYGSRSQFMPKIELLFNSINSESDGDVARWLMTGSYNTVVPQTTDCFYRLYTCATFNAFLTALAALVKEYGCVAGYLEENMHSTDALEAIELLCRWFRENGSIGVVPRDTKSSCKRLCMFLRWMVRTDSPVDLGLWRNIIDRRSLIIPMDTHVVQEANRLGLLTSRSASMTNARRLTARLAQIWPDDPLCGDFALFGVGVAPPSLPRGEVSRGYYT